MPYGVRGWPDSCDPRAVIPCFCLEGFGAGAYPPYRWQIKTDADPPFDFLDDGYTLPISTFDPSICTWFDNFTDPAGSNVLLRKIGYNDPADGPDPPNTLFWRCEFNWPANGTVVYETSAVSPFAIQTFTLQITFAVGNLATLLTNPLEVIPRIYDAPIGS